MKYVIMTYNPSKRYSWTLHRADCADINRELKGIHTDSGFTATDPETIEGETYKAALKPWLDTLNADLIEEGGTGWTESAIKINPCCR